MDVNKYLKHVMIDGCEWLQVVASGCSWMHTHTLGTRSAQSLSYCICIYVFIYRLKLDMLSYGRCACMNDCALM